MLFKTYQKLLGASCLALYLMGCGSGGGTESPVEIRVSNNGDFQISSKVVALLFKA
ncbi:lipoprotein [Helicobacter pylori]|nr:lipoprotein [Helicobacter pylori]